MPEFLEGAQSFFMSIWKECYSLCVSEGKQSFLSVRGKQYQMHLVKYVEIVVNAFQST